MGETEFFDRPAAAPASALLRGATAATAAATGVYDVGTTSAVTAFQRHYRQFLVDGVADRSTITTLRRLIDALASG
jgi:peptidoglycan hydrolase-like protein with peptidoglycan-binding domain